MSQDELRRRARDFLRSINEPIGFPDDVYELPADDVEAIRVRIAEAAETLGGLTDNWEVDEKERQAWIGHALERLSGEAGSQSALESGLTVVVSMLATVAADLAACACVVHIAVEDADLLDADARELLAPRVRETTALSQLAWAETSRMFSLLEAIGGLS